MSGIGLSRRLADVLHVTRTLVGAPTTGTWNAGDHAVDDTGAHFVCIVGGTPGTWIANVVERAYVEYSTTAAAPLIAANRVDFAGMPTITFDVYAGEVVYVVGRVSVVKGGAAGASGALYISDTAGADAAANIKTFVATAESRGANSGLGSAQAIERITVPGTYSRKLQVQSFGATMTFGAAGTPAQPTTLRATKGVP